MKKNYLIKILHLFSDHRSAVILILIYMFLLLGISCCLPFFSKALIDEGFLKGDKDRIVFYALCVLGFNTAGAVINILKRKQALRMSLGVRAKMQQDVFRHLLRVKISYFIDKNATSTFHCMEEDIAQIAALFNDSTLSALTSFFSAVGGGIALFLIDWHLGIAVILFTPLMLIISGVLALKCNALVKQTLKLRRRYSSWFGEAVSGIRDIRLFGLQHAKEKEMAEQIQALNSVNRKCSMLMTCNTQIQTILTEVLKALIYLLAAYYMIKSHLTVGSVIAFQSYMLMVSASEAMIIGLFYTFYTAMPHIRRYYDFFDEPAEKNTGAHITFREGDIEFRNVGFSYEPGSDILCDISLKLPNGSKTVIVGDNGAGKTTCLNLLLSLLEPVRGDILVNGKKISEVNPEEYRQLFSVVSQDVFLFHDTLRNNLCLGRDISQETLDAVIRDVNLEDVAEQYGMDYMIEQNGANLSGGQKQKIALARALIMDRPVLVFDEATANLDKISIRSFINLFDSRLKHTTVICVSHSDEIIDSFDNRLIFSNGSITAEQTGCMGIRKAI